MSFSGYPVVFELAVYRVDFETWERESLDLQERLHTEIPAWAYNDAVGWLRLSTSLRRITADLVWREAKRLIRPTMHPSGKFFNYYMGKAFDLHLDNDPKHSDIFELLIDRIDRLTRNHDRIKGRHIDTTALRAVGPRIAWRELVGLD